MELTDKQCREIVDTYPDIKHMKKSAKNYVLMSLTKIFGDLRNLIFADFGAWLKSQPNSYEMQGSATHNGGVTTYGLVTTFTVPLAVTLIFLMLKNRVVETNPLRKYVRYMLMGQWRFTGDVIQISDENVPINTCHRAWAFLISWLQNPNIVVPVSIVWGVKGAATAYIDNGVIRDFPDIGEFQGLESNVAAISSNVVKLLIAVKEGSLNSRYGKDNLNYLETMSENPEIVDSINYVKNFKAKHNINPDKPFAYLDDSLAATIVFIHTNNIKYVDDFLSTMYSGVGNAVFMRYREHVAHLIGEKRKDDLRKDSLLPKILKAFKWAVEGATPDRFWYKSSDNIYVGNEHMIANTPITEWLEKTQRKELVRVTKEENAAKRVAAKIEKAAAKAAKAAEKAAAKDTKLTINVNIKSDSPVSVTA